MADGKTGTGPLSGLRVLEIGHFVAAPFAARLMGDLGADVIKIEPREGDPVRQWGEQIDGKSLWWSMHGRNKRSVVLDLKSKKGQATLLRIVPQCDVVIENFRPGQLARWGLGAEALRAVRPDLVIAHISGYGQDGPYSGRAAFGVIGEAIGGLRYLTNQPPGLSDTPPVRVGVSIGDSVAGLYAAFGVMAALWQRDRSGGDGRGRTVDVALTESIFSMMEGMLPEYGALGKIKQPTGGAIATAAPSNAYPSSDQGWILIAANSDPLFVKLANLVGQADLAKLPQYRDNPSRVRNAAALDVVIGAWTRKHSLATLEALLNEADIPNSRAYTVADCAGDPQYIHRDMICRVPDPAFGTVLQAGVVPRIVDDPGAIRWAGPSVGQHTDEVLLGLAGLTPENLQTLKAEKVTS